MFFRGAGDDTQLALIDFQWSGYARTGCGDLAYFLLSNLEWEVLTAQEDELTSTYFHCLLDRLRGRGIHLCSRAATTPPVMSAEACQESPTEDESDALAYLRRQLKLEVLDYGKTALPYLLAGITPAKAAENASRYGWLTHESDPRVMAWMCERVATYALELCPAPAETPAGGPGGASARL